MTDSKPPVEYSHAVREALPDIVKDIEARIDEALKHPSLASAGDIRKGMTFAKTVARGILGD